jgi:hypothetical protein
VTKPNPCIHGTTGCEECRKEHRRETVRAYRLKPEYKEAERSLNKEYREANKEVLANRQREHRSKPHVRERNRKRRREYDLTPLQRVRRAQRSAKHQGRPWAPGQDSKALELLGQDLKCACCGRDEADMGKSLCFDHCHRTGELRGLLCHGCNFIVGYADDNLGILPRVYEYLNSYMK